ncbi:MAG: hypothetical protein M3Q73_01645 [bacterium]|nr:hypothetical protein [bacterium]
MRNVLIITVVIVLLGGVGFTIWNTMQRDPSEVQNPQGSTTPNTTTQTDETLDADASAYIRANISKLSTEPEVLGGTFYVTNVVAASGRGVVGYEDGHNAYTADFTYERNAQGSVNITSFTVRR